MTLDSLSRPEQLKIVNTLYSYETEKQKEKNNLWNINCEIKKVTPKPSLSAHILRVLILPNAVLAFFLAAPFTLAMYLLMSQLNIAENNEEQFMLTAYILYAAFWIIISILWGKSKYNYQLKKHNHETETILPGLVLKKRICENNLTSLQQKLNELYNAYRIPNNYHYEGAWEYVYKQLEFSSSTTINQALSNYDAECYKQKVIADNEEIRYQQSLQRKAIEEQTQAIKEGNQQIDSRLYELNETARKINDYNRYGY